MTARIHRTPPVGPARPFGLGGLVAAGLAAGVVLPLASAEAAMLKGARTARQAVTLDVPGPIASETDEAPNPFLDVRLDVTFTSPSGIAHRVPGHFAGNGLGHGTGDVWRARFSPEEPGTWRWSVDFDAGENLAVGDDPGRPLPGDGADGTFEIAAPDPLASGFARTGRLRRADGHHLRDADGDPWLRAGIAGPGSLLGYAGFDGTVDGPGGAPTPGLVDGLHRYEPHVADWREGDPDFRSEDTGIGSRGIVGAINYLADQGVNSIRFPLMNLGGDGRDTHPFVGASGSAFDDTHYDVSKLFQWRLVLEHMNRRGVSAHVMLSERGHDNAGWLDAGELGIERRLYHRELVARFGHLNALTWNIGGEGRHGPARTIEFARHVKDLDGARHPVSAQAHVAHPQESHVPLLGRPELDAVSLGPGAADVGELVETWRARSAAAGRRWTVDADGIDPVDAATGGANTGWARREALYPTYLGGANLEWRLGEGAPSLGIGTGAGDFRLHEPLYRWTRIARELATTYLPLDRAVPDDGALVGGDGADQVLSVPGEVYALHLLDGLAPRTLRTDRVPGAPVAEDDSAGATSAGASAWEIAWFDPRAGRFDGERRIAAGPDVALGAPPSASDEDWVVLVRRADDALVAAIGTAVPPVPAAPMATPPMRPPANPLATLAPVSPPIGAATPPALAPMTADGGGGGATALLLLVMCGRLIRSRTDASRLVYCRAPSARPEHRPCRRSR